MKRQSGLTLIEVVIAISLVSLIMLGLVSAMRTLGESGARLESRMHANDALRLVPPFLERAFALASARARFATEADLGGTWFSGGADHVEWLGVMPARHGAGGLSHFRLAAHEIEGSIALALQVTPFVGGRAAPDWHMAQPEVLVPRLQTLELAYLASEGGDWQRQWSDPLNIPGWVMIRLRTTDSVWPDMMFRLLEARPNVAQ